MDLHKKWVGTKKKTLLIQMRILKIRMDLDWDLVTSDLEGRLASHHLVHEDAQGPPVHTRAVVMLLLAAYC